MSSPAVAPAPERTELLPPLMLTPVRCTQCGEHLEPEPRRVLCRDCSFDMPCTD